MKILLDVAIFHSKDNIEFFKIAPTKSKKDLLIERLKIEEKKIKTYLLKLRAEGKIKSIKRPKNTKLKLQLRNIVRARRNIKKSIRILKKMF